MPNSFHLICQILGERQINAVRFLHFNSTHKNWILNKNFCSFLHVVVGSKSGLFLQLHLFNLILTETGNMYRTAKYFLPKH